MYYMQYSIDCDYEWTCIIICIAETYTVTDLLTVYLIAEWLTLFLFC